MEVFIGADHGGFDLKEGLKKHLESNKIVVHDVGTFGRDSVNYVDYAFKVARNVSEKNVFGVICCSSGIGVSIVANKVHGVRAALCTSNFHAEFSRKHNDANVICFGQKVTSLPDATRMLDIFLDTKFEGGRHKLRVESIYNIEKNY